MYKIRSLSHDFCEFKIFNEIYRFLKFIEGTKTETEISYKKNKSLVETKEKRRKRKEKKKLKM